MITVDWTGKKAEVDITTNEKDKTGTITVKASFALYAQRGSFSQKELDRQAKLLKKQIESTYKGNFNRNGISFKLNVNITVTTFASGYQAAQSGSDNLVGLIKDKTVDGKSAVGESYSVQGESFDRMVVATESRLGPNNTFAHEFGHLLGADHTQPNNPRDHYPLLMQALAPAPGYVGAEDAEAFFWCDN